PGLGAPWPEWCAEVDAGCVRRGSALQLLRGRLDPAAPADQRLIRRLPGVWRQFLEEIAAPDRQRGKRLGGGGCSQQVCDGEGHARCYGRGDGVELDDEGGETG